MITALLHPPLVAFQKQGPARFPSFIWDFQRPVQETFHMFPITGLPLLSPTEVGLYGLNPLFQDRRYIETPARF